MLLPGTLPGTAEVEVLAGGMPILLLGIPLGILPGTVVLPKLVLLLGVLVALLAFPGAVGVGLEVTGVLPRVLALALGTLPGMDEVLEPGVPRVVPLGVPLGILPGTLVLPMLLLLLGMVALGVVVSVLPMVTTDGVAGLALPKPPWACACCAVVSAASPSIDAASTGVATRRLVAPGLRWVKVVDMGVS